MNPQQRAECVLSSQGYAVGRTFPAEIQDQLSALCSEAGELSSDVREKCGAILKDYWAEQKAVVDEPNVVEVRGEIIQRTITLSTADGTLVPDWPKPEPK